jgi:hypothetical protein
MRKVTDPGQLRSLGWKHKVNLEKGIELLLKLQTENSGKI